MYKQGGAFGDHAKPFLVKDCVHIGAEEYGVLRIIYGLSPRTLLIRVSKHAILAEPAFFASRDQVRMFRAFNMVCYTARDVASQRRFG
jgi:hypothetical protein